MSYNGWKTRETWNLALWLGNDEGLYNMALDYLTDARLRGERVEWVRFLEYAGIEPGETTPDGVPFRSNNACRKELREALIELA
jgi:hypothetical protein